MIRLKLKRFCVLAVCAVLVFTLIILYLQSVPINEPDKASNGNEETPETYPAPAAPASTIAAAPRITTPLKENTEETPTSLPTVTEQSEYNPTEFTREAQCTVHTIPRSPFTNITCGKEEYFCKPTTTAAVLCPLQLTKPPRNYNCSSPEHFMKLMETRRARIAGLCKSTRPDLHIVTIRPRELFYFDKVGEFGLTWCPVFKAGSSNTNAYFCPLYYEEAKCHNFRENGANLWRFSQFFAPQTNIPRFMIARNPFERILSAYRDKVEGPDNSIAFLDNIFYNMIAPHRLIPPHNIPQKEALLKLARNKADMRIKGFNVVESQDNPYENPLFATFEEFIRALLTGNANEHWSSINRACAPCSRYVHYDYILQVEDLDCEFNNMLAALEFTELQGIHNHRWETNRNPSRRGVKNDLYEYYGDLPLDVLRAFHGWFKEDCELFGYDCEKVMCQIEAWRTIHRAPLT